MLHLKLHNEDLYVINNHFKCCGDRTIETDPLYECDVDENVIWRKVIVKLIVVMSVIQ